MSVSCRAAIPQVRVVFAGCGAVASVGLSVESISAAMRGRLNRFTEHSWLRSARDGAAIVAASLETLAPSVPYVDRLTYLATLAAKEAVAGLAPPLPPIPILLSVPVCRPGVSRESIAASVQAILRRIPIEAHRMLSATFELGNTGGLAALGRAIELVEQGASPCCLVGGVDSWIDIDALNWLEEQQRLKSDEAPNGLIPGEAASFVLVAREEFVHQHSLTPTALIRGVAFASEPSPWYMGKPTKGEAATAVFRAALERTNVRGVETFADLNGESWRVDEWVLAYLRTGDRHAHPLKLRHPADCWGDVGAATAALLMSIVAFEFHRRSDGQNPVLVSTASDTNPWRAGCLLAPYSEAAA